MSCGLRVLARFVDLTNLAMGALQFGRPVAMRLEPAKSAKQVVTH